MFKYHCIAVKLLSVKHFLRGVSHIKSFPDKSWLCPLMMDDDVVKLSDWLIDDGDDEMFYWQTVFVSMLDFRLNWTVCSVCDCSVQQTQNKFSGALKEQTPNSIFYLLPVVLFINLDSFGVSFGDISFWAFCLLSNIMGLMAGLCCPHRHKVTQIHDAESLLYSVCFLLGQTLKHQRSQSFTFWVHPPLHC